MLEGLKKYEEDLLDVPSYRANCSEGPFYRAAARGVA